MADSLRDFVAGLDDRPKLAVMVRAWNNRVIHIRMIEADERAKFDKETERRRKPKVGLPLRIRERLVILCAEDEHGAPAFKKEDEEMLAGKANAAIDQLFRAACKHNGFVEDDDEEEDDGKNS